MRHAEILRTLPNGTFEANFKGRAYTVSKTTFAGGKSLKLVAEAKDGSDYISLNMYDLAQGPRIYPCEMPLGKVLTFLENLEI